MKQQFRTSTGWRIDTRKLHPDDRIAITCGEMTGEELQTFIDSCYTNYLARGRDIVAKNQ